MEGLRQYPGLLWCLGGRMESDRGEAGDKHDFQALVHFGGALGELDPIHTRHDDIRQQQIEVNISQAFESSGPVTKVGDRMSCLEQGRGEEAPQRLIVLGQKNLRHACYSPEMILDR